jgi:DNA-binding transcriptional MocR family regulator
MADGTEGRLYAQATARLKGLIENGTLAAGDRLPSVREYARLQAIGVNTVLRAYRILEDQGYLETRPQSGHFVRRRQPQPAKDLRIPEVSDKALSVDVDSLATRVFEAFRRPNVLPLGAACPPSSIMPWRALSRHLVSAVRQSGADSLGYYLPPGYEPLLRQLARRSLAWGCALSARDFVITSGCSEALNLCLMAVAGPGDVIAVESPAYFGALQMIENLGMKVMEMPMHPRKGMSLDALEEALKHVRIKACIASPNFQNPVGSLMSDADKERLVRLLSKAGIPLIEDDTFGDLAYEGKRPRVAKSFDRDGNVQLCSSFSKTLAPGYRVGWVAGGRFHERLLRLKTTSSMGSAVPTQMAVASFLEDGGYEHHLRRLRTLFASQAGQYREAVLRHFPAGTRVSRPQGGHVLWVEMPEAADALRLFDQALKRGISVAPGSIFSPGGRYRNFIRLNCGVPWSDKVGEALATLGKLAGE